MAKAKKPQAANAAKALLREVGKPHNAHTIDIDALRTLNGWLAVDETMRAKVIGELAAELDAIRTSKVFAEFKDSAWNIHRRFNDMIAIARALDKLIRPRLPLTETTLLALVRMSTIRYDYSAPRLVAQLEHYGKTIPLSPTLREALVTFAASRSSRDAKLVARVAWLTSENQPARAAAEAAKAKPATAKPEKRDR